MSITNTELLHYTEKTLHNSNPIPADTDILFVGAGMSSLYVAWRLLNEDPSKKITILDMIDRTGGRLDSDIIKIDGQEVKEEEGGMRFTFGSMDNLNSLFLYFDLVNEITPFPMNSGGNNRLYFRGRSFTNADALGEDTSIWSKLYHLEPAEQGGNPKQIINTIFNRILSVNREFLAGCTPEQLEERGPDFWQKFRLECQWRDIPLYQWTLQGLMSNMGYSKECITLLYSLLGFNGTFLSEMNAGVAYQLLEEFPAEPNFKTLKRGFSTLPNKLVELVGTDKFFLKTRVEGIDKNEDGSYAVFYSTLLTPNGAQPSKTPVSGSINAKKIILGLPRLALEKLFIKSNAFRAMGIDKAEKLWNNLQATSNQPLLKINLYYDRPWWSNGLTGEPPVSFGPNFSDLPLGSVYPFYSIDEKGAVAIEAAKRLQEAGKPIPKNIQEALDKKYTMPAALTIYCDYLNINFWKGLQHAGAPYMTAMQEEHPKLSPASALVVEEATKFFKKLFNTHYVPAPLLTSARIWAGSASFEDYHKLTDNGTVNKISEQVGYGVHQWALGAKDDDVIREMVQPIEGESIYTCGESLSDYQGWVEGALRSANLILEREEFGKLPPVFETNDFKQKFGSGKSVKDLITEAYKDLYDKLIKEDFPAYESVDHEMIPAAKGVKDEVATAAKQEEKSYALKLSYDFL